MVKNVSKILGTKYNSPVLGTLTMGTLGAIFLLNYYADPSYALFFSGAEEFLKGAPGISVASAAVTLVFNVLRGLFLLYVGLSLVTTVNALRQDEDWQSVARTPLLVALAVGVSDIVTNLIVK